MMRLSAVIFFGPAARPKPKPKPKQRRSAAKSVGRRDRSASSGDASGSEPSAIYNSRAARQNHLVRARPSHECAAEHRNLISFAAFVGLLVVHGTDRGALRAILIAIAIAIKHTQKQTTLTREKRGKRR